MFGEVNSPVVFKCDDDEALFFPSCKCFTCHMTRECITPFDMFAFFFFPLRLTRSPPSSTLAFSFFSNAPISLSLSLCCTTINAYSYDYSFCRLRDVWGKKAWFRKLKSINTLTFVSDSLCFFCEYVICVYDVVQRWWQKQTCACWSARLDWVGSICKWIRRWTMPIHCFSFLDTTVIPRWWK